MTRIFAFPFAGGNSFSYKKLSPYLEKYIEVTALDYPGHGSRIREPLLENIHDIVDDIFEKIKNRLSVGYVLYGHSLGGVVAFLLAEKLNKLNYPLPCHLILSGTPGPMGRFITKGMHLLPCYDFYEALSALGGVPEEILLSEEIMRFFEPVLKADLKAIDSFCYEPSALFNIPITVLNGTEDLITAADSREWEFYTCNIFSFKMVPGNHFFIMNSPAMVAMELNEILKKYNV